MLTVDGGLGSSRKCRVFESVLTPLVPTCTPFWGFDGDGSDHASDIGVAYSWILMKPRNYRPPLTSRGVEL